MEIWNERNMKIWITNRWNGNRNQMVNRASATKKKEKKRRKLLVFKQIHHVSSKLSLLIKLIVIVMYESLKTMYTLFRLPCQWVWVWEYENKKYVTVFCLDYFRKFCTFHWIGQWLKTKIQLKFCVVVSYTGIWKFTMFCYFRKFVVNDRPSSQLGP